MNKSIDKFKKHHEEMKNDLVSETSKSLIEGIMGLRFELMDLVETKDDILKIEYKEDQKVVDEGIKELNRLHGEVPSDFKKKLNKIIKFMKELPNDVFYNITKTVFTSDPLIKDADSVKQLHNLNSHFYIQNYLYSDKIKGMKTKNLFNKNEEVLKEINNADKSTESDSSPKES